MILLLIGLLIGRRRKEGVICLQLQTRVANQITESQKG
jgi:hypothetical protein